MLELTADACIQLRGLIESTTNQDELTCRKYLSLVEDYLFKNDTLTQVIYAERETPINCGQTDYIISGRIGNNPVNAECIKTYIWELKAPQCVLFRKDNDNRLKPTAELCEAENQLLNYYHSLKYDWKLVNRFKAGHPSNVFAGGIIIGSKDRIVSGEFENQQKKSELVSEAYAIRSEYFYKYTGLSLVTWTDVLSFMEQKVSKKFIGLTKTNALPNYVFSDTKQTQGLISIQEIEH